jgi:hypothetical protein
MKKITKVGLGFLLVLVALLLILIVTLPLTVNPLVKSAATTLGPKTLGVPVAVGEVQLNPFTGRLAVSGLRVGNPPGYSERPACAVEKMEVVLRLRSLLSDVIVIEKIQVEAPAISYESKEGLSNFDAIKANTQKAPAAEPAGESAAGNKPEKKVIIELFTLKGAQVAYTSGLTFGKTVNVPLPALTLRDIGKESGGATAADAAAQVAKALSDELAQSVKSAAGNLQTGLTSSGTTNLLSGFGRGVSDAASNTTQRLRTLFK